MNTQSLRNARRQLNTFRMSDRAFGVTVWTLGFVGALSHLFSVVLN